jgi:hypothetical protein
VPVTLVRKQEYYKMRIPLREIAPLPETANLSDSDGNVCRWRIMLFSKLVEQIVTQQFYRRKATMKAVSLTKYLMTEDFTCFNAIINDYYSRGAVSHETAEED